MMYVLAPRNGLGQDVPGVPSVPGLPYVTTALRLAQIATAEAPIAEKAGAAAFAATSLAMPVAGAVVGGIMALATLYFGKEEARRAKREAERMAAALSRQAQRYTEVMAPLTETEIRSMADLRDRLLQTVRSVQDPISPLFLKFYPHWSTQSPRDVPIFAVLREWAIRWGALYPRFDRLTTELGWQSVPRPWTWKPILIAPIPGLDVKPVFLPEIQPFFAAFEDLLASAQPGTLAPPGVTVGVVRDVPGTPSAITPLAFQPLKPSGFMPDEMPTTTTARDMSWLWLLLPLIMFFTMGRR